MKRSSEALDRFQDDEEIRKKLLASGAIRLTPKSDVSLPDSLQQCILGGQVVVVGRDGKVLVSSAGRTVVHHIPKAKTHTSHKK